MVKLNQNIFYRRVSGTLFGLAAGDALGALTEGMDPHAIEKKYGYITGFQSDKQTGTDDTEFALFYIDLLEKYGLNITADIIARHWLEDIYHSSETYKGAGFSEAMTLRNLKQGLIPPDSGKHLHSWSDGLAMCAAPFGCAFPGKPDKAAELASVFGCVSHSGEGIYGGMAVAAAVSSAMAGSTIDEIIQSSCRFIPGDSWVANAILTAADISQSAKNVQSAIHPLYTSLVCDAYPWPDLAPEAVGLAFGLFVASEGDFEKAVLGAVNMGRDSDTIAAISGALCGASGGIHIIPPRLLANIYAVPGHCIRKMKGRTILSAVEKLVKLTHDTGNEYA